MATLNTIEEKLRDRSIKEINELIDDIEVKLNRLQDAYGGANFYEFNKEKSTSYMNPGEFRSQLRFALKSRFLDKMVQTKTNELLDKLEII